MYEIKTQLSCPITIAQKYNSIADKEWKEKESRFEAHHHFMWGNPQKLETFDYTKTFGRSYL